jgi:antitoxin FitA
MEKTAAIIIRKLSPSIHRALKQRAKRHGRSAEAEVRDILEQALRPGEKTGFGDKLAAFGQEFGGIELDIPPREATREPPRFE